MVHVVISNGLNLPSVAYADTACAKSVTGQQNADALMEFWKARSWPYAVSDDEEPFRFGPEKRIWSKSAGRGLLGWPGHRHPVFSCGT